MEATLRLLLWALPLGQNCLCGQNEGTEGKKKLRFPMENKLLLGGIRTGEGGIKDITSSKFVKELVLNRGEGLTKVGDTW